ncbi:hypothetical protein ACFVJ8_22615 [Streptomyces yangpuensis]|uniref:hypothetical protein n=1 Tax=Streptomyces yangpuensis TaxID=1648182 RepID=UPI00363614E0
MTRVVGYYSPWPVSRACRRRRHRHRGQPDRAPGHHGIPWLDHTVRVTDTLKGPLAKGAEARIGQGVDCVRTARSPPTPAAPPAPSRPQGPRTSSPPRYGERIDRHVVLDAVHGRVPLTPQTTATWTDAVARQRTD